MARTKTVATGGSIARDLVRRWARRRREAVNRNHDESEKNQGYEQALDDLLAWLAKQPKRLLKKSGLGRA